MIAIEKIINILYKIKNNHKDSDIYLFGSYVWGNPRKDSDLDIAVNSENILDYFDIIEEIEESNILLNFDFINLNTLNNNKFKERILNYGKKIWYKI